LKINADLGDLNCFKRLGSRRGVVEWVYYYYWFVYSFLMDLFGGEGAFFVSFRCNKINVVSRCLSEMVLKKKKRTVGGWVNECELLS
jgi:hypothetical protein